jgi:hypothetical protein
MIKELLLLLLLLLSLSPSLETRAGPTRRCPSLRRPAAEILDLEIYAKKQ